MKRKMLAILTSALLICAMLPLGAVGVSAARTGTTSDGINYEIVNDQAIITGCEYYVMGEVNIPSQIAGYPVTTIGKNAFYACIYITDITIPDSVHTIKQKSFAGSSLISVTIPSSVVVIGEEAFHQCHNLISAQILGNATIENRAFYNCIKLRTLVIGDGVQNIGEFAFASCHSLLSVSLSKTVTNVKHAAFNDCVSLANVYYGGNVKDKNNIPITTGNNRFFNATWNYNCINPKDHYSLKKHHSVMDTANGNGLAFRFELLADGIAISPGNEINLINATINYLGKNCSLLSMGVVLTNNDYFGTKNFTLENVNNNTVLNAPTIYLQYVDEDSCAFATRVINIPDAQLERVIYARPYYVVEVDGEAIVVYGDVDSASCAEYM